MINFLPHKISNPSNPFYVAWNKVIDALQMSRLVSSDDIAVIPSSGGTTLKLNKRFANKQESGQSANVGAVWL